MCNMKALFSGIWIKITAVLSALIVGLLAYVKILSFQKRELKAKNAGLETEKKIDAIVERAAREAEITEEKLIENIEKSSVDWKSEI